MVNGKCNGLIKIRLNNRNRSGIDENMQIPNAGQLLFSLYSIQAIAVTWVSGRLRECLVAVMTNKIATNCVDENY